MTTASDTRRGLRLVTATDSPDQPVNQLSDLQVAEGVLQFQALWAEFDAQMFSPSPDHEHMLTLILEINTLRQRLEAHGVRVRA